MILDIRKGEFASGKEMVSLLINGNLGAGDDTTDQIRIAPDTDIKSAIPGGNAALSNGTQVIALDLLAPHTDAARSYWHSITERRNAQRDIDA